MTAGVSLRPLTHHDLPMVLRWLHEPHVRRWWVDEARDLDDLTATYAPRIDGAEPTEMLVIVEGDRPVGLGQRYLVADDPEWARALAVAVDVTAAAGIDYLVGEPDAVNRGVGTAAVAALAASAFDRWPVDVVVVAVQQANRPSWRALERAGFTRRWSGRLDSDDPSDAGPAHVYSLDRAR